MSIQIICEINFFEFKKIRPMNKEFLYKNFYKTTLISWDYQTVFM